MGVVSSQWLVISSCCRSTGRGYLCGAIRSTTGGWGGIEFGEELPGGEAAPRLVEEAGELGGADLRKADQDRRVAAGVVGEEGGLGLGLHEEALFVVFEGLEDEDMGLAQAGHELLA